MPFLLPDFIHMDKIRVLPQRGFTMGITCWEKKHFLLFNLCLPNHSFLRNTCHNVGLASSRLTNTGTESFIPVRKCTFLIKCKFVIWKGWIEFYFKKEFQLVKFSVIKKKKIKPRIVSGFEPTVFLLLWIGCIFIHCKHFLQCLSFWEHVLMILLALIVPVFPSEVTYLNFIIVKHRTFIFILIFSSFASSIINQDCCLPFHHLHLLTDATFAPLPVLQKR